MIKILKIDAGLFGGIIGKGEIKVIEKVFLPEIEPIIGSYQDMIKVIKIRWTNLKSLTLIREDQREYNISVTKTN